MSPLHVLARIHRGQGLLVMRHSRHRFGQVCNAARQSPHLTSSPVLDSRCRRFRCLEYGNAIVSDDVGLIV